MLLALVVAVVAVALGAALTVASGARPFVLGPLRTFAATAAAAVVLTHLLPEALSELGLWGALAFAAGLLGPALLHPLTERLAARRPELSPARLALEAGFIGLFLHHVGDGLGIGAYAALPGGVTQHVDVILALVAHTVPLVAVVTLAYRSEYGLPAALRRSGALALASALGVLASFAVPSGTLASASAWIGAVVSGVLLHVVTHDWLEDLPSTEPARIADLLAGAIGLSLSLLGGHEPGHAGELQELFASALALALGTAPWLLLGLGITALLREQALSLQRSLPRSPAVELGSRLVLALGAEGLCLGLACFGVLWALVALVATLVLPLVASGVAMAASALARGAGQATAPAPKLARSEADPAEAWRFFDRATALWVVALAAACVLQVSLAGGALLGSLGSGRELALAGALGLAIKTGGPIVLVLGALSAKGLSPGAALLAATLSSALGAKTLAELWRRFGGRLVWTAVLWLTCLTAALAIGLNRAAPIAAPIAPPPWLGRLCLWVLLGLTLLRAQRVGLRRWLAGWLAPAAHAHHAGHGHGHAAGAAHSSEIPNGKAATTRSPEASGPSAEA